MRAIARVVGRRRFEHDSGGEATIRRRSGRRYTIG